jgi:hypothetical protein
MGTFRKVDAEQAGAEALGILIPPARRTFVILRPRSLPWDLLLCRGDEPAFREMGHDEASAAAQALFRALRDGATADAVARPDGCLLRVKAGPFALYACERRPGHPYAVLTCAACEAEAAVAALRRVVCPADGVEQELYFNVRFFERQA